MINAVPDEMPSSDLARISTTAVISFSSGCALAVAAIKIRSKPPTANVRCIGPRTSPILRSATPDLAWLAVHYTINLGRPESFWSPGRWQLFAIARQLSYPDASASGTDSERQLYLARSGSGSVASSGVIHLPNVFLMAAMAAYLPLAFEIFW